MISLKPTKGHLLVAEPSIIGDTSFNRSVILLADEGESGFIGFILNKPLTYTIKELVPEINSDFIVYNGGPVEQDNLYFIHQVPQLIPDSVEIANGIYWGGNIKSVTSLLELKKITENDIRFFLGYSGWETSQLDQELQLNSWIVVKNKYKNKIISKHYATFWKEKMVEFGGDYLIWSNAPENPNFN
ncbi:MAG: transcriptional regulator [Bacteroidetes bacterium HGW-Bacteroidetes-2]|jgi:putative transcriptional regulator|nr:MAG: transcriptional regulator [Bacteroidetes bacterium HGW-Bacteroidetes-2]